MSPIAHLLPPGSIAARLEANTKDRLFAHVGERIEQLHAIPSAVVVDALFARERLGSTALGLGIAIPHGRLAGLKQEVGFFAQLAAPIDFDASDGRPVGLAFFLLVPAKATEKHLQLLSELAQMFSDSSFRSRLAEAPDAAALQALFTEWQPKPA